jgi:arylformamidase
MTTRNLGIALGFASGVALLGTAVLAQRPGAGISRECRREVISLCGLSGGRAGIRACLTGKVESLSERCRTELLAVAAQRAAAKAVLPANARELSFGADALQKLDLWPSSKSGRAALIVFIHGGGWSIGDKRTGIGEKDRHFTANGYAFASVNYRLVPQVTPAEQAQDVAAALALLRTQPGIDPDRIVLMGHSAGAHLAALVGTDPSYFAAAGVPMASVRGVILLDGAGYDVAKQMQSPANIVSGMYKAAFTTDPKRQAELSPTLHAAAPNAAYWLIINDADRRNSQSQSDTLAAALTKAGSRADRMPIANTSHTALNRNVGVAGDAETARIDAFIAEVVR